jgi:hypothetical protein
VREFDIGMFFGFLSAGLVDVMWGRVSGGMGHILGGVILLGVLWVYNTWVKG